MATMTTANQISDLTGVLEFLAGWYKNMENAGLTTNDLQKDIDDPRSRIDHVLYCQRRPRLYIDLPHESEVRRRVEAISSKDEQPVTAKKLGSFVAKLSEWFRRMWEAGLRIDDLLPDMGIDDRTKEDHMLFCKVRPSYLEEPELHTRVREIMGSNFIGLKVVMTQLGKFYGQELLKRMAEIPFSITLLEQCKDTHVLAPGYPISVRGMVKWKPELFSGFHEAFIKRGEPSMVAPVKPEWLLQLKDVAPETCGKEFGVLSPPYKVSRICELAYVSIFHYIATGECFKNAQVHRWCADKIAASKEAHVYGQLSHGRFFINSEGDQYPHQSRGMAALRVPD